MGRSMKRACVIGWPIEQSRSPMIHGYWLKVYGIEGAYTKVPVKPEDVQVFLKSLENEFEGQRVLGARYLFAGG
jgi:shikimate dehydrogenase